MSPGSHRFLAAHTAFPQFPPVPWPRPRSRGQGGWRRAGPPGAPAAPALTGTGRRARRTARLRSGRAGPAGAGEADGRGERDGLIVGGTGAPDRANLQVRRPPPRGGSPPFARNRAHHPALRTGRILESPSGAAPPSDAPTTPAGPGIRPEC